MGIKLKNSELVLILISTIISVVLGLTIIRWLQPSLLGISDDLVLVKSAQKKNPFYENIFDEASLRSSKFILKDPVVKGRARPLFPEMPGIGPNDILGFRNEAVPNRADIE